MVRMGLDVRAKLSILVLPRTGDAGRTAFVDEDRGV